ncbi:trypsin-like serine peptidase [Amantichitinum ursilacus]|uniref:Serine protease n=1 Tax=Amantichitinum ursilacus TaxID=857265 RepID=A0A0N0GN04_9NEIS|nr:trypsin-like peptidase domain-containing protein [Amantichitinum ursilacus]KPC52251.1 Trypsin [Amantichitinum ursilacus]
MKRLFLLCLALCASVAFAREPSVEQQNKIMFYGHDDRVIIHTPFTGPYAAIGVMRTQNGYDCTATLITPDTALTAAHCFWMAGKNRDHAKWFKTAYDNGRYTAHYRVLTQTFNQRFQQGLDRRKDGVYIDSGARPYDIAVLKVELVDGTPPTPMPAFKGNRQQLQQLLKTAGYKVSQAGYPEDLEDVLAAHRGCKITALSPDNTVFHQCDTLEGDSGAPVWIDTANGPLLIAVQSSAPPYQMRKQVDNIAVTVLQRPEAPSPQR